jgi:hypothetical protein
MLLEEQEMLMLPYASSFLRDERGLEKDKDVVLHLLMPPSSLNQSTQEEDFLLLMLLLSVFSMQS